MKSSGTACSGLGSVQVFSRVGTVKYGGNSSSSTSERQQCDDVFDDDDSNRMTIEHIYECLPCMYEYVRR